MSNILYINNEAVDLSETMTIPISYSIADFKKPESRKRSVSKTIKLVGTQKNKRIFSSAYNLSLTNTGDFKGFDFNPNTKVKARYYKNGVEIFNGFLKLLNVMIENKNYTFEVVLFSDFVNIVKAMADIKTNELDWSKYDHNLTLDNIAKSWDTSVRVNGVLTPNYNVAKEPDGFGYWYPVIDFGYNNSSLHTIKIENFVPYVYVRETFLKCFEALDQGYTIESNFFDSNLFKSLTWGFGGGEKTSVPPTDLTKRQVNYSFDNSFTDNYNALGFSYNNSTNYSINLVRRYFLSQFSETLIADGYAQYDSTNNRITILKTGTYNLSLNYNCLVGYTVNTGTASGNLKIVSRVIVNGRVKGTSSSLFFNSPSVNFNQTTNTNLSLNAGDEVYTDFFIQGTLNGGAPFNIDLNFDLNNSFSLDLTSKNGLYVENDVISLPRFLPSMKCSDYVKAIITMFNLYVSEPDENNVIKVEPLDDYYSGEVNYTELMDHSKVINIKPVVVDSAKNYSFKFTEDNDYFNREYLKSYGESYGNFEYTTDNEYSNETIEFKVPFAQTVPFEIGAKYILPKMVDSEDNGVTFKPYKGKPRIFFNNGLKAISGNWSILASNGLNSYTTYPQAHHSFNNPQNPSFDLNFGKPLKVLYNYNNYRNNNLFNAYHRVNIIEQTSIDGKILTAYFKLNENTIGDFSSLVNINGVLYRKNKITDYDANGHETTKVELYKVLETSEYSTSNPVIVSTTSTKTPVIRSPKGVGGGVKILRGGKNTPLRYNPKLLQL